LAANPEAILRHIAATVGITERGVQKIIGDLEEAGFLTRDRVGRRNVYRLHLNQPLRHPVEQHRTIGDIVHALYPTAGTVTSSRKRSA
jgi:DNA-binding transcriptional regulator PaaX